MDASYPRIILKPGRERSLLNLHPWIFSGAVDWQDASLQEGDVAEVFSKGGNYLATVHFHKGSIMGRVLSFKQISIQTSFFEERIQRAFQLRTRLSLVGNQHNTAFRLVHGEADGLPGLIIDVYNRTAVIQAHTMGMYRMRQSICDALMQNQHLNLRAVFDKTADVMHGNNEYNISNAYLAGEKQDTVIHENGIRFEVPVEDGQKTGHFLDQRDNRKLFMQYAPGKKVLNAFSYTGGFSLYAMKAGAVSVHSVDSSKKAGQWITNNIGLNNFQTNHKFFEADVFDFLKNSSETFDALVIDPPAFAKHLSAVRQAVIGYRNLNHEALKKTEPGGIVFTFSCSQAIDRTLFNKIIFSAASQSGRDVKILHRLSQSPDHPVSVFHPEGEYLKGLVLYVS